MHNKDKINVALIGNPNCGKTSVFNMLVGAKQHVGNFPGCTVEKKEGLIRVNDLNINIIDLPGTYSLSTFSIEERIVIDYIIDERPDIIINVIDSSCIERNLYLTVQCLELNIPMIICMNMFDELKSNGIKVDINFFSELIGRAIVPTIANRNIGKNQLLSTIVSKYKNNLPQDEKTPYYSMDIEEQLERIITNNSNFITKFKFSPRMLALRLLENDQYIINKLNLNNLPGERLQHDYLHAREEIRSHFKNEPKTVLIDERYAFIKGLLKEAFTFPTKRDKSLTEKIDAIFLHPVLGLPIFILLMFILFELTFEIGNPLSECVSTFFDSLKCFVSSLGKGILHDFVANGIIGGVGSVLVFVPHILILFFMLSILEESGYMPRVAFVMDNFMHLIGLHGKSFVPMLIGFGCNVPAIMSTRMLNDEKDRLTTILIIPFMSCSARLPVYILISAAFFSKAGGFVVFSFYVIGMVVAIIMARIFRFTLFKGMDSPFVMELPPYRVPTLRGLAIHTWQRTYLYIKKAGTIILALAIVVWIISTYSFPWNSADYSHYDAQIEQLEKNIEANGKQIASLENHKAKLVLENSILCSISKSIEPVFEPLGFNWKMTSAILAGFGAKEVVVGTLGVIYSVGHVEGQDKSLQEALKRDPDFTPLTAYVFMLFILLYFPCVAVIGVAKRETNSWGWTMFLIGYSLIVAWTVSFAVYQIAIVL